MRVSVERSGGFAGIVVRASADTASLLPEAARQLAELASRVDFAALTGDGGSPPQASHPAGHADRFVYAVRVEAGGSIHDVVLPESALPQELALLVRWVLDQRGR